MNDLERTFAAVLCGWEQILAPTARFRPRQLARLLEGLSAAGIEVVIITRESVELIDRELGARPRGPGRLHAYFEPQSRIYSIGADRICPIEPAPCGSAKPTTGPAWARDYFRFVGIGAKIVLVAGISPVPAGYERSAIVEAPTSTEFLALLQAQLARERHLRVPDIDDDAAWVVHFSGFSETRTRADESLLTLSNGSFGTRGSLEEDGSGSTPAVLANGIYTGAGASERLQECPIWTSIRVPPTTGTHRLLDLRSGVVIRHDDSGFRSIRLVPAHRSDTAALRAEGRVPLTGAPLIAPPSGVAETLRDGRVLMMRTKAEPHGGIAAAASQRRRMDGEVHTLERIATYVANAERAPAITAARQHLEDARAKGFAGLLREHRAAWARNWREIDIEIPDDPDLQRAIRFSLFHTLSCAADSGEAAVGARGLTGVGYAGHVFWDTDVFVLPTLTALAPKRARAMLEYRIRRLDAARAAALALGRRGARFPWESARDGSDVTPRTALVNGIVTPILTGQQQEHIVADVAWAAWHYAHWSGDDDFLVGAGYPLLVETARYWASRVRLARDGRAHIDHVIGPDEYHVDVNDNAFTNAMARWNLRSAARLAGNRGTATEREEAAEWCAVAAELVDGYDPQTRLYEQFHGYFDREPLLVSAIATPPVAADLLLGSDRLEQTQIIKQADALMIHHLLPDDVAPGSLEANLDYYAPRTAHGSSLSPAIYAGLHARAGQFDEAMRWLRLASRFDLDDVTAMTSGGLHMANLAGVWQAIAFGFLGLRWDGSALRLDPRLPPEWSRLTLRCVVRRSHVEITVADGKIAIGSDPPLPVRNVDADVVTTTSAIRPIR